MYMYIYLSRMCVTQQCATPPQAHGDTSFFLYSVGFYYEDFVWAVCSVMSRQNEIPLKDGKSSALALIPLWDMCNHWMGEWVDGAGGREEDG